MSKLQVPYFSESAIHLAHLCALETWQGYSYATGKQFREALILNDRVTKKESVEVVDLSDEYFLERLSKQLFSIIKPRDFINTFPVNDSFLDAFRKVAGIKQTERRGPKPCYVGGIAFLKNSIAEDYRKYQKLKDIDIKKFEAIIYYNNLSVAFTEQKIPDANTSEHIMLATRLLFFAMPNCLIFNYSPEIAKGLKLAGKTENHIAEYQEKLWSGLNLNWATLCNFDMPLPKHLPPYIYDVAKKSGWWQRRIFDLALKHNFTKGDNLKISEKVKSSLFNKPNIIV